MRFYPLIKHYGRILQLVILLLLLSSIILFIKETSEGGARPLTRLGLGLADSSVNQVGFDVRSHRGEILVDLGYDTPRVLHAIRRSSFNVS